MARVPGSEADGWDELAGAKPDGYTIGIASQGILMQSLQKNGKYNYFTSLDPLAGVAVIPVALVINGGRSVTDLAGLVAEAGGQVRTLRVGYPLPGSIFHVVSAAFLRDGALTAECVSLKNTAAVISALEDGSLDGGFRQHHRRAGTVARWQAESAGRNWRQTFAGRRTPIHSHFPGVGNGHSV